MSDYRYSVSLRAFHPSRSFDDLTAVVGIEPRYSGVAGQPRTNPRGQVLGTHRESFWSARLINGDTREQDLPSALTALLDQLEPHRSFLAGLAVDAGVRLEFFIGWFFDEGNSGDLFSPELLARLSALRIGLHFDVYPEIQSAEVR